jgi:signal transduction histidine kinase
VGDARSLQHERVPRALSLQPAIGGVPTDPHHLLQAVRTPLVVAGTYYASARLGLLLQFRHTNASPVWPASGLAVASLLLLGRRQLPALTIASFLVNLTTGLTAQVSAGIATGNTIEYLLAAELLRRSGLQLDLARIKDVVLVAVSGIVAPLVAASVGTFSLWLGGVAAPGVLDIVWLTWWLGDGIGILVFGSALLTLWAALQAGHRWRPTSPEAPALGVVAMVGTGLAFLSSTISPSVLFPLAIWAGVRFEQLGAAAVTLGVSTLATYATVHGSGRFAPGALQRGLIPLQLYTASYSFTAMAVAAAITSRRRSEERLRERTVELEVSNQELEAFSYTVSHDLRAPLRAIHGFSSMLAEEEGTRLSTAGALHLATITRNAEHMGRLIDALLGLARVGRGRLVRQPAHPTQAARAAVEHLQADLGERPLDILIDEMPTCRADPVLLEQVYENLIGNAVKFTRERQHACVHAGWQRPEGAGHAAVYYVRDNGVGFDMRYAHRLFNLFERLHQKSDIPGIGAGLAIVERIVRCHGGAIWAEAAPGSGATFYFTIGGSEERT